MGKLSTSALKVVRPRAKKAPRNRSSRAERVDNWNAAHTAGAKFGPAKAEGSDARYRWLTAVLQSDLKATTRLVAYALSHHGTSAGERIYPGIRELARLCAVTQRAVSTHIDHLVRRGFLARRLRGSERSAGARGFEYGLLIPRVLKDVQHSRSVLKEVQHSAERYAQSAERKSSSVLKDVQRSSRSELSIELPGARAQGAQTRARRDQQPANDPETLRRQLLAELACAGLSRADIQARGFGEAITYAASIGCALKPSAVDSADAYRRRVREWEVEHPRVDAWPDKEGQLKLGKGRL